MSIRSITIIFITAMAVGLGGCSSYFGNDGRRGVSSSLVDYLYPDGQLPHKHEQTKPHLRLPLRVGLAFVPKTHYGGYSLPEAKKSKLLERVRKTFIGLEYVESITVIPDTYMRSTKGFSGVGQIARLYGVDVMALVSYDQLAQASDKKSSLLYWTIVGAYFIKGSQNHATTFVDTAVFDVNSQKMLFRAPGVSEIEKSSTLIEVSEVNREVRTKGFTVAMENMTQNLSQELDQFERRVKDDRDINISTRQGYGGGGSLPWWGVIGLIGLCVWRYRSSFHMIK